jgi:hypothetical protein
MPVALDGAPACAFANSANPEVGKPPVVIIDVRVVLGEFSH